MLDRVPQSVWDARSPHAEAGRRRSRSGRGSSSSTAASWVAAPPGADSESSPTASGSRSSSGRDSRRTRRSTTSTSRSTPSSSPTRSVTARTSSGHSYGGVITLLAAAAVPESVHSLTVIEPPAMKIAEGNDAVDAFIQGGIDWWQTGPTDDPEAFLRGFLTYVGSDYVPPSPLPPQLEQGARTLIVERNPWEAEIDLDTLAAAAVPEARRHGRPPRRLRRRLRRARRATRRRAARAAGLRPHGAAPSGVQRRAGGVRRSRERAGPDGRAWTRPPAPVRPSGAPRAPARRPGGGPAGCRA